MFVGQTWRAFDNRWYWLWLWRYLALLRCWYKHDLLGWQGMTCCAWIYNESENKGRFCNTIETVALVHTSIQAINEYWQRKSLNQKFKTNVAAKLPWNQYGKLSLDAGKGRLLREVICLRRKEKGKSKVLSSRFCLGDLEAEQRALWLLHIHCSNVNNYSSAPKSNSFLCDLKVVPSLLVLGCLACLQTIMGRRWAFKRNRTVIKFELILVCIGRYFELHIFQFTGPAINCHFLGRWEHKILRQM